MCGIFGLLYSNMDDLDIKNIDKHFMKGLKRGPEYSVLKNYTTNNILLGFHRLAINGLNTISNQPIEFQNYSLICNGEIYNHSELTEKFSANLKTDSDCEIISYGYSVIGTHIFNMLDGVFSCIILDKINNSIIVARDPYGVRPLYLCEYTNKNIGLASDISPLLFDKIENIKQFEPGTYSIFKYINGSFELTLQERYFFNYSLLNQLEPTYKPITYYMYHFVELLKQAIYKRVQNCEREVACLLSGGLDSSIISAFVSRFYYQKTGNIVETYSIGLEGSEDLKYTTLVSNHIKSLHRNIIKTNDDFINSIPNVIQDVETYDTTTVRASTGNWNIGKYIKENSNAKVIFNGDGADELMGGYLYFKLAPNNDEFDKECKNLLSQIRYFDVLRSDKSISSHGLEPRTPFLDKELTKYYLSIPIEYRNHNNENNCEKYFIRKAIETFEPTLLPKEVLWRKKEAFSDGVSSQEKSWYEIIQNFIDKRQDINNNIDKNNYLFNPPSSKEQLYYRQLFEIYFPNINPDIIPHFWMPKYVKNANDASARTLDIYDSDK